MSEDPFDAEEWRDLCRDLGHANALLVAAPISPKPKTKPCPKDDLLTGAFARRILHIARWARVAGYEDVEAWMRRKVREQRERKQP